MIHLDAAYWDQRYQEHNTPWNIGSVSPPLRNYINTLTRKDLRILIPGAGHAHEAAFLYEQGFTQVFVCDWADSARVAFFEKNPGFPKENWLCQDFFSIESGFDLLLEQTFFCAIDPSQRTVYAKKVRELLVPDGYMAGLLFAQPFDFPGPPFGGTEIEYRSLFSPHFEIIKMETAKDSIAPRAQRELWIELRPRS
jgi:hypothetical protein